MSQKELKPLLEQFNIPLPETIDLYNLIGLDFGDGELSAAFVQWNSVKKQFVIKGLSLDEGGVLTKNPNAYYISPSLKRFVYDARETEITSDSGLRYYNFKKCVGTDEAKAKYILDNGKTADMTYSDVMAEGFNIAVNTIFKYDAARLLDPEKPTIILVGCPSSAGWEKNKLEYAELLRSRLSLPSHITAPVYVAIHKESNAALARELDPKWGTNRIKRHEVIVILDNGSSTFDITVVGVNGIPENGEDSYQFGGNRIDENLLALMWKLLVEKEPGMKLLTEHGHKLGLRIAKETYYGLDGDLRIPAPYMATLNGKTDAKGRKPRVRFEVNDDIMDEALEGMPVTAFHFSGASGSMIKKRKLVCSSWLDGCRKIYQAFYDEMKQFFVLPGDAEHPVVPHRIILSGGVSVMPEVRELVREVFGVEPVLTAHPNYSVSEGLAYVLVSEVRKGQFLRELLSELPQKLPGKDSLRESIIKAGIDEDWITYKESLKEWSQDSSTLHSIRDWYDDFFSKKFNQNLDLPVQEGAKDWFEMKGIETIITTLLQKKFETIFPEYTDEFHYSLPKMSFSSLKGIIVNIRTDYGFLFGELTSNEELGIVISSTSLNMKRNQAWRVKAYQNVLQMENKVKKGGSNEYSYRYMKDRMILGPIQKTGTTTVTYAGLDSMYREKFTDPIVQGIRNEILNLLEKPLKEYVELITPYFNMTARK